MARIERFHDGLMLLGIAMALLGGMALAMAAGLFLGGADEAHAQLPTSTVADKSDTGDGEYAQGEQFAYALTFTVSGSQTSEIQQWSDTLPGPLEFIQFQNTNSQFLSCQSQVQPGLDTVECTLPAGSPIGNHRIELLVQVNTEFSCTSFTNELHEGPLAAFGPMVDSVTSFLECLPTSTINICKEWPSNGVLSGQRTFQVDVSDSQEFRSVALTVTEGGAPSCRTVVVTDGQVRVTEQVPPGFDEPLMDFQGTSQGADNSITFSVSNNECFLGSIPFLVREEQVIASCRVTFTNSDNDTATVTATPTFVVCPRCNTPAVPTSTPTPPPSNTATPPPATATQPSLPTAAPTTGTGSGTGGLTDAQRTQTAVAAARTAAAQSTPLPPRTGAAGGGPGGSGGVNVALFAMGLLVLSAGLGVIAVRSRR